MAATTSTRKPSRRCSDEATLLEWCAERVGERAAIPKAINTLEALPTTAVGKIFKPRLVWNEIDFVTNAELDAFDERIAHRHVYTAAHSQLGGLTEVRVTAASGADPHQLERDIESSLGEYSFARRVVVAEPVDR